MTITITGTNDTPTVAAALSDKRPTRAIPSHILNVLANASDKDDGETATLTVTNVGYMVDGGTSSATAPAGVSHDAIAAQLRSIRRNAAYDHLAAGATTTVTVNYRVSDDTATSPATVTDDHRHERCSGGERSGERQRDRGRFERCVERACECERRRRRRGSERGQCSGTGELAGGGEL